MLAEGLAMQTLTWSLHTMCIYWYVLMHHHLAIIPQLTKRHSQNAPKQKLTSIHKTHSILWQNDFRLWVSSHAIQNQLSDKKTIKNATYSHRSHHKCHKNRGDRGRGRGANGTYGKTLKRGKESRTSTIRWDRGTRRERSLTTSYGVTAHGEGCKKYSGARASDTRERRIVVGPAGRVKYCSNLCAK